MELSFFAGFGLGSIGLFFTMKTLQKQEVTKLKRNFSNQQEVYEQQLQRQEENHDLEITKRDLKFKQKITALEQQVQDQIQTKNELLNKLEKEKELNLINQKKLRESNRDIDEILESLEQSQIEVIRSKDQEIGNLQTQIREYAVNLEQQHIELFTVQQQSQQSNIQDTETGGHYLNTEQIQELINIIFPEIVLLRDSLNIVAAQPENLVQLIKALKDIMEGQAYSAKKIRATDNKWTECRVPHINLMRLYYQKCKKSGYQVLISPKKNQKSQDQDYEWLKNQSSC